MDRHEMRTMSSLPDLEVYKAADECRKLKMIELKGVDGLGFTLSFQPIPAAAVQVSQARGGNSMGVEPKSQQCMFHAVLKSKYPINELCRASNHGRLEQC